MVRRTGKGHRGTIALLVVLLSLLFGAVPASAGDDAPQSAPVIRDWIVALRPATGGAADALRAAVGDAALSPVPHVPGAYVARFAGATAASDGVARLLAHPAVQYVEPDLRLSYAWVPNDPLLPQQGWAHTVGLPAAWSLTTGSPATVVAVVDSGVHAAHPDLAGKVLDGFNFLSNTGDVTDDVGHGTAVAAIVAARGNDGVGIAGAAMDVRILPVKVGDGSGAPVSAIAAGIRYAVDRGASVINLSLGADSESATLHQQIQYAYSRNVPVIAAAGNDPNRASFPASYQEPISVGAASPDGTAVAEFSSRLSRVDLTAPGVAVLSASWEEGSGDIWQPVYGTSFAAPIVAGTVALMRSVNPALPIEAIRAALTGTARQTYPAGTLGGGAGLLDAGAAVRQALLPALARTWQAADQPVAALAAQRTWLWGPAAFAVGAEPYVETPHGERLVAYFDKARMEITDPHGDSTSPWYVTTGLLATELISGRLQVGHAAFEQRAPANIPVAGDPDDATGPRYATFAGLLRTPPLPAGAVITQTVDQAGHLGADARLASYGVTAADYIPETGHRVANVFADYLRSEGLVLRDGQYRRGPLFDPPYYATGYPITEAYWTQAKVAGQVRDVLVQCFERRCLTYTPSNPAGWQVEMGNVGRHYYQWRTGSLPPAGAAPENPVRLASGPQ
ncbi:MAG: S8 family serine peptidase [Sphaerobacter sp.]|nr:S8 family serine peptidase [Sphaerobacter sp.]